MKRFILLMAFLAPVIFCGTIYFFPLNRTVKDEELPSLKMVNELTELVAKAPYKMGDYEWGVFDCSNESALIHDFLTAHGYHCTIVIGVRFEWEWFSVVLHAWIIAEKNGKKMWVNASGKDVVYQGYYEDYFVLAHFKSLLKLQILATLFFLPHEWEY